MVFKQIQNLLGLVQYKKNLGHFEGKENGNPASDLSLISHKLASITMCTVCV